MVLVCEHGNPVLTCPICNAPPELPPPEPDDPTRDEDTGTKSVIGEITEAFDEISQRFFGLRDSFKGFGTVLGVETQNLGKKMETSVNNMKTNVENLTLKFKKMGENLANILNP